MAKRKNPDDYRRVVSLVGYKHFREKVGHIRRNIRALTDFSNAAGLTTKPLITPQHSFPSGFEAANNVQASNLAALSKPAVKKENLNILRPLMIARWGRMPKYDNGQFWRRIRRGVLRIAIKRGLLDKAYFKDNTRLFPAEAVTRLQPFLRKRANSNKNQLMFKPIAEHPVFCFRVGPDGINKKELLTSSLDGLPPLAIQLCYVDSGKPYINPKTGRDVRVELFKRDLEKLAAMSNQDIRQNFLGETLPEKVRQIAPRTSRRRPDQIKLALSPNVSASVIPSVATPPPLTPTESLPDYKAKQIIPALTAPKESAVDLGAEIGSDLKNTTVTVQAVTPSTMLLFEDHQPLPGAALRVSRRPKAPRRPKSEKTDPQISLIP